AGCDCVSKETTMRATIWLCAAAMVLAAGCSKTDNTGDQDTATSPADQPMTQPGPNTMPPPEQAPPPDQTTSPGAIPGTAPDTGGPPDAGVSPDGTTPPPDQETSEPAPRPQ